jgi:hypothetical protein
MDTLLTESMVSISSSGLSVLGFYREASTGLRGISAKNGAQLELIEYHARKSANPNHAAQGLTTDSDKSSKCETFRVANVAR